MSLRLSIDDQPKQDQAQVRGAAKQVAVAMFSSEALSFKAVTQRLGLPNGSLAKWVRQARIDCGDLGQPEQGQLTSEERTEMVLLRK
jgi:transposase-like protein